VAEYRAGNWQAAIDAFEKSNELGKPPNRWHFLFLAMAHWQRGDKSRARELYQQAVESTEKNRPGDPEVEMFRAEAEALMGIKKKK
jgi:hypothetical protein